MSAAPALAIVLALVAATTVGATVSTWSVQSSANPSGTDAALFGMSCISTTSCTAAGSYTPGSGGEAMLVERLSGGSWSAHPIKSPAGDAGARLDAVGCSAAAACTAVGTGDITGKPSPAIAERWNGTSWKPQSVPVPKTSVAATLLGVACPGATTCIAVGDYMLPGGQVDPAGPEVMLAETWNGSGWARQKIPRPSGDTFSQLSGISCSSPSNCTAVGFYLDNNGPEYAVGEHWDGTAWTLTPTPPPTGGTAAELNAVSCPSNVGCIAVGDYRNASNIEVPLAERWNGSAWNLQSAPRPSGATLSLLSGVGCASLSACAAVGDYTSSTSTNIALAEAWNGTAWHVESAAPSAATSSDLWTVACPAASLCFAAGEQFSTAQVTLVERGS